MRNILTTKNSTHAERKFAEYLKELHIPFKHRVKINNNEVDFLIGKYAVEIDGHKQDPYRNKALLGSNYIPIHFQNKEIHLTKTWLEQIISHQKHQ